MSIFLKMILGKLRYALMLRYVPTAKKSIESELSTSDMQFIDDLISSKPDTISSNTLLVLLEAYQSLKYAVIPALTLELALIKIINGEK